ncbi:hypothetical protein TYRP_006818 [Tyrophagus putrescentiae]|nr:hypothetical protein TYRP_006818 [Tyrophagus putrescentiae]
MAVYGKLADLVVGILLDERMEVMGGGGGGGGGDSATASDSSKLAHSLADDVAVQELLVWPHLK